MRKNHSKTVCIKLVHLPYLYTNTFSFSKHLRLVSSFNSKELCASEQSAPEYFYI